MSGRQIAGVAFSSVAVAATAGWMSGNVIVGVWGGFLTFAITRFAVEITRSRRGGRPGRASVVPLPRPDARERVVGVVEPQDRLLRSPTGRACVAFHVRGDVAMDTVDDAMSIPFAVRAGELRIEVRGDALVDLSALDASRPRPLCEGAAWPAGFLETRALGVGPTCDVLREQVLVAGDEVELLLGGPSVGARSDLATYRTAAGTPPRTVYEEDDDHVLAIVARAPKA